MLAKAWDRFWFAETPLTRVAALRMTIMAIVLMDLLAQKRIFLADAASISNAVGVRQWTPIYMFDVLGIQPIGTPAAEWIMPLALVCASLALVGLWSRFSCFAAGALLIFISGMNYSFGKPHHEKIALTFCLLALPFAPIGARLSLDSLVRRFRRSRAGAHPSEVPRSSEFAALPIRLTMVSIALGYWFAGMSKLLTSGVEWTNGYTLMAILMGKDNTLSLLLSSNLFVVQCMSVGVIVLQVSFPLAVFVPWTRWILLPGAVGFHWGTWFAMDTGPYMTLWLCLVCFISLEKVPTWIRQNPWTRLPIAAIPTGLVLYVFALTIPGWMMWLFAFPALSLLIHLSPRAPLTILFDGSCRMCRAVVALILALDWADATEAVDLRDWDRVQARWPQLDSEACIKDMHSIGSEVQIGYATYRAIAWRLPLTLPFAWLMGLPPASTIGKRIYRRIADQRTLDGCN